MFLGLLLSAMLVVEGPEVTPTDTTTARSYKLDEVVVSAFKTNKYELVPASRSALSANCILLPLDHPIDFFDLSGVAVVV